jgi:hypothetical protein
MRASFDPDSNVNEASDLAFIRASAESAVNDPGRQSDFSPEHPEKTPSSIVSNFEPDSKRTDINDEQSAKQRVPRKTTPLGIIIDFSETQQ